MMTWYFWEELKRNGETILGRLYVVTPDMRPCQPHLRMIYGWNSLSVSFGIRRIVKRDMEPDYNAFGSRGRTTASRRIAPMLRTRRLINMHRDMLSGVFDLNCLLLAFCIFHLGHRSTSHRRHFVFTSPKTSSSQDVGAMLTATHVEPTSGLEAGGNEVTASSGDSFVYDMARLNLT